MNAIFLLTAGIGGKKNVPTSSPQLARSPQPGDGATPTENDDSLTHLGRSAAQKIQYNDGNIKKRNGHESEVRGTFNNENPSLNDDNPCK